MGTSLGSRHRLADARRARPTKWVSPAYGESERSGRAAERCEPRRDRVSREAGRTGVSTPARWRSPGSTNEDVPFAGRAESRPREPGSSRTPRVSTRLADASQARPTAKKWSTALPLVEPAELWRGASRPRQPRSSRSHVTRVSTPARWRSPGSTNDQVPSVVEPAEPLGEAASRPREPGSSRSHVTRVSTPARWRSPGSTNEPVASVVEPAPIGGRAGRAARRGRVETA